MMAQWICCSRFFADIYEQCQFFRLEGSVGVPTKTCHNSLVVRDHVMGGYCRYNFDCSVCDRVMNFWSDVRR